MPFTVTYLEEHDVVETVYSGSLGPSGFAAAVAATGEAAGEHVCARFLSDCRELDGHCESATMDIWALADFLATVSPEQFEREALVLPAASLAAQDIAFYETACRNRGLAVRVFDDRGEALAWLTS